MAHGNERKNPVLDGARTLQRKSRGGGAGQGAPLMKLGRLHAKPQKDIGVPSGTPRKVKGRTSLCIHPYCCWLMRPARVNTLRIRTIPRHVA